MNTALETELKLRLENAGELVPAGFYYHRKSGHSYLVTKVCLHEPDLSVHVIYHRGDIVWSRPIDDFVQRFSKEPAVPN